MSETRFRRSKTLLEALTPSPLTLLEKASLKLIETDILNEEPEKALRLIGRMIESMNELEDSPVTKGPGVDPELSRQAGRVPEKDGSGRSSRN